MSNFTTIGRESRVCLLCCWDVSLCTSRGSANVLSNYKCALRAGQSCLVEIVKLLDMGGIRPKCIHSVESFYGLACQNLVHGRQCDAPVLHHR